MMQTKFAGPRYNKITDTLNDTSPSVRLAGPRYNKITDTLNDTSPSPWACNLRLGAENVARFERVWTIDGHYLLNTLGVIYLFAFGIYNLFYLDGL